MSIEAARLGTYTARHEAIDRISTRASVPCEDGQPSGPRCGEVRHRTLDSEFEAANDTFTQQRGTSENDPYLAQVAGILDPAEFIANGRAPDSQGPLASVLLPWQAPPPAHGDQYELYVFPIERDVDPSTADPDPDSQDDAQRVTGTSQVWIDGATKMPVKSVETVDGRERSSYWTYNRDRAEVDHLSADFFRVPAPTDADMTGSTMFGEAATSSPTTDRQTATSFRTYSLGDQVSAEDVTLCLDARAKFQIKENVPRGEDWTDDPLATMRDLSDITRVDAIYRLPFQGDPCVPNPTPSADSIVAQVSSLARSSEIAAAYRDEIVATATAIELDPTDEERTFAGVSTFTLFQPRVAHSIAAEGDGSIAFVEIEETALVIRTPFAKASLSAVLANLEEM